MDNCFLTNKVKIQSGEKKRRAGSAAHLGSTEELTWLLELRVCWPWGHESQKEGSLTSSDASQTKIQGSELPYLNIYHMSKLLECTTGLVLQIQNYKISVTQAKNQIFEESQWGSRIDRKAESRGLVPDQWVIAMNICKERSVDKGEYYGIHGYTLQLPWSDFLLIYSWGDCKGKWWIHGEGE